MHRQHASPGQSKLTPARHPKQGNMSNLERNLMRDRYEIVANVESAQEMLWSTHKGIIPAEDPNSDYILQHFGKQRLSHVQRNIASAGWLAGHLYSTIEWLKKRISKSDRF